jgi:hypothetical protein
MSLKIFIFNKYFWLNWLMDDGHLGYIPKKNMVWTFLIFFSQIHQVDS